MAIGWRCLEAIWSDNILQLLLLPVPGFVSLAREVFPDYLSGTSSCSLGFHHSLETLLSTAEAFVKMLYLVAPSPLYTALFCQHHFSGELALQWGQSHRSWSSVGMSQAWVTPLCVHPLWRGQIPALPLLVFPASFLCAEWLRLHDTAQREGQQWRPCLSNPKSLTHCVPRLRSTIKFRSSYLGVFPISSEISR